MNRYSPNRVCACVAERLKGETNVSLKEDYVVVEYCGVPFTLKQKYDLMYLRDESEFLSSVESILCEIKGKINQFERLKEINDFSSIKDRIGVTLDLDNEYGHRYLGMDFSFYLKDVELPYHFISWLSGMSFEELLGIALDNYVKSHLVKFSTEGLDSFLSSACDPVVMFSSIVEDYLDRQYKEGCYVIFFSDFTCTTMPIDRQRLNTHVGMYERMEYGVKHKILVYSDGKFKED